MLKMTAFDMILTATFTGFGVAVGQTIFEFTRNSIKKHRQNAEKLGEKIGSSINSLNKHL